MNPAVKWLEEEFNKAYRIKGDEAAHWLEPNKYMRFMNTPYIEAFQPRFNKFLTFKQEWYRDY